MANERDDDDHHHHTSSDDDNDEDITVHQLQSITTNHNHHLHRHHQLQSTTTNDNPGEGKEVSDSHWRSFLFDNEEIVLTGKVSKRRRPFNKTRQLILTTFPRLLYVDAKKMVVRGEVPWSGDVWAEQKNSTTFYVHTVKRSYYMQGLDRGAKQWVDIINKCVQEHNADK